MMEETKNAKLIEEKTTFMEWIKEIKPLHIILVVLSIVIFTGTIIGIINYRQKARREQNPKLEVTAPADGQALTDAQIVVEGNTYKETKVTVNGKEVIVDAKGNFAQELALTPGKNQISVIAESKAGKSVTRNIAVERTSPEVAQAVPSVALKGAQTKPALNSSGPETLWITEIIALSGAGAAWQLSRKNFLKALKR